VLALAIALALILGFAAHRASICTVRAVAELNELTQVGFPPRALQACGADARAPPDIDTVHCISSQRSAEQVELTHS
jgi:hypothetical protein